MHDRSGHLIAAVAKPRVLRKRLGSDTTDGISLRASLRYSVGVASQWWPVHHAVRIRFKSISSKCLLLFSSPPHVSFLFFTDSAAVFAFLVRKRAVLRTSVVFLFLFPFFVCWSASFLRSLLGTEKNSSRR